MDLVTLRDRCQILPLILNELKHINEVPFLLKSSENRRFSDDFRWNRG